MALTLRAVGGLSTAEIARALLVPEATVGTRISRAKQRIKRSRAEFQMPPPAERPQRIAAVLHVLYLIFNEGYTAKMVTLNRIVAVAMVHGPQTGLRQLTAAEADPGLAGHHRVDAVRAHLLDLAGDHAAAREHYRRAARHTLSIPEQRYLQSRAADDVISRGHRRLAQSRPPAENAQA